MDLTTRARVKGMARVTHVNDDAFFDQMIVDTSSRVEKALSRHTQQQTRTEIYRLRRHQKVVWLRGFPARSTSTSSVKYASTHDFTNITALTEFNDYNLDDEFGLLRLRIGASTFSPSSTRPA